MIFSKIKLTKQGTLEAVYKNEDGDVIHHVGANLVHKDLKTALQGLIPHLAIITEQREAYKKKMKDLREQSITDSDDNIFKRLSVEVLSFSNDQHKVSLTGSRILINSGVLTLTTPNIDLFDEDDYEYQNDLALDVDAVLFEAKAYIEEKKWGVKQANLDFKDIDPYKDVEAGEVPEVEAKGKKPTKVKKVKIA